MENGNSQQRKSRRSQEVKVKAENQKSKTSDAISRANDYCERIRNRELVITPQAENIQLTIYEGTDRFGRPKKEEHSLAFLIAKRMTAYQSIRDMLPLRAPRRVSSDPRFRVTIDHVRNVANYRLNQCALDLLEMIDQASTHGVIREENLWNKLEECQKQNERLKEKADRLEKENQKLHETLKKFGKVGHIVSDVPDAGEDKP